MEAGTGSCRPPRQHDRRPVTILRMLGRKYPAVAELEEEVSENLRARGRDEARNRQLYIDGIESNREEAGKRMGEVSKRFEAGRISGRTFREQVDKIEAELRGRNQQLSKTHSDVVERFDESRMERLEDGGDRFFGDLVYDQYRLNVTSDPSLHDADGFFRPDRFRMLQDRFRRDNPEYWDYVQRRRREGR